MIFCNLITLYKLHIICYSSTLPNDYLKWLAISSLMKKCSMRGLGSLYDSRLTLQSVENIYILLHAEHVSNKEIRVNVRHRQTQTVAKVSVWPIIIYSLCISGSPGVQLCTQHSSPLSSLITFIILTQTRLNHG